MADRDDPREVWITGVGVISAIGIGLPAFRAGLRANASPVKRIDRFDPAQFRSKVAAQVDDFDPADHMDARRSAASTGSRSSASRPAGWRWPTPGSCRAWTGRPTASGSGSTSGRRWAASPSPRASTRSTWRAACDRSPPPSRSRSSAGPRRPTSASPSTSAGRSCPPPTRARPARSRSARRWARSGPARSTRRSPAASSARCPRSRSAPSTSSGPSGAATTTTRRTRRGRWTPSATGSSWARAPGCWCWRPPRSPAGAAPGPTAG